LKIAHVTQHASIYHNETTFAVTRIVSALNASKMHLRSQLCPEPHWGSLQHSPRDRSWWGEGSLLPPFGLEFRPFGPQECTPRQIPGYATAKIVTQQ